MNLAKKKSIAAGALLALLVTIAACEVYDDHDYGRYRYGRYYSYDRDGDGRIERWERYADRYYDPYYAYYDRDYWRYDRGRDRWERRSDLNRNRYE